MASRPSQYLDWTDGSPTKVVQPPSNFLLQGWVEGQAPPAEYMNWLFWDADMWIQWFDFITFAGNLQSSVTSATTVALPVRTYLCNPTSASFSMTLLGSTAVGKGVRFTFKNIGFGSANTVTVQGNGTDDLEGSVQTSVLNAGDLQTWEADGNGNWYLV